MNGALATAPWPAPRVLEAVQNPDQLPAMNAQNGATAQVRYDDMRASDLIAVLWLGTAGPGTPDLAPINGSVMGFVDVSVPVSAIAANLGKSVTLFYAVLRDGEQYTSDILDLAVLALSQADLTAPTVPQTNGTLVLDLNAFIGDAQVLAVRWPLITAGQRIWLRAMGTASDGAARVITLAAGRVITPQEFAQGLNITLPRVDLQGLLAPSPLAIELKVSFDGSLPEHLAQAFPSLPLTLQASGPITAPRPIVMEAPTDYLHFPDIYDSDFIHVSVPIFTGMVGTTIRVRWSHDVIVYWSEIVEVTTLDSIDFPIPRLEVVDVIGRSALIEYTVYRGGVLMATSAKFTLRVSPQPIDLPAPRISANNQVVSVTYPALASGQSARVRWTGVVVHDTGHQNVVTGRVEQFNIPAAWVTENRGKTVLINYSVLRRIPGETLLFSRVWRITL